MSAASEALYTGRIFPGLRPFEAEDALLFFGREEQTDELLRRLDDTRFLAVVGLSGSGKSSLVRAGLLPALRRGHLTGAGSRWRDCVMRPGSDPLGTLARVLNQTLGEREDRLETLRTGRLGLVDASRHGRNADENLLLVVDQFEEIFRFQDSYRGRAGEASRFVELLLAAAQEYEPEYRVYVVITLRSDFLGECARFRELPEALNESQYLVPRMTREQLREVIAGPAALGGLEVASDLLQELLDKTGDAPDQLPVLQHLLMRMWEIREPTQRGARVTFKEYGGVGGWDDALNRHADAVLHALPEDRQNLARRIFQRLTERGRAVRRPATVRELTAVAEMQSAEVKAVIEHFREEGCNFLTSPDQELTGNSVIDISHESLIRRWNKLKRWAEEEADWGKWYQRVEDRKRIRGSYLVDPELESALQARENGRWNEAWAERYATDKDGAGLAYEDVILFLQESKRKRNDELGRLRRERRIVAVAAILFAALSVAATYFWWSASRARGQAEQSAREASRKQKEADQERQKTQVALTALDTESRQTDAALQVARQERALAESNADEADRQKNRAVARLLASDSELVRNSDLDWDVAALLGIESLRRAETVQGYDALWRIESATGREVARIAHPNGVLAVAFSPDGTLVATRAGDRTVRVFEARTGREVSHLTHPDTVSAVAFSPDGTLVATGSLDKTARVFEARTGREVSHLTHQGNVSAVAFSPDGTLVATGSLDKTARVFEARTGREVSRLVHQGNVSAVAFSPDSILVTTGSLDQIARVFEARTGREVSRLVHQGNVSVAAFSPEGTLVATGSGAAEKGEVRVFEARTGREVAKLLQPGVVSAVAFSPDGTVVASGSQFFSATGEARVFEARTGREVSRLGHPRAVSSVAFSPDGTLVATGSYDNTARVFEARTGREVSRLAHRDTVSSVAFSPDGTLMVTGSGRPGQGEARVFEARTEREVSRLALQGNASSVAFSSNGTLVATGSLDNGARVFDARSGREVARLDRSGVFSVAFSSDGTLVTTGSWNTARVFETLSGREVARLTHPGNVYTVDFSPDGALVATGSSDKTARVFEARTGREVSRLTHQDVVYAVSFSPDGTLVATGSADNIARVFETRTGRELARLANLARMSAVAFSPDGTLVAAGSWDNTARVFETRTGREVARLAHQDRVSRVVFSPDGKLVATGAYDNVARVFEARTGREVARLALGEEILRVDFVSGGRLLRTATVSGPMGLRETQDPVRPSDLISEACSKINRNLTREEWSQYLGRIPYRQTCEKLNMVVGAKQK